MFWKITPTDNGIIEFITAPFSAWIFDLNVTGCANYTFQRTVLTQRVCDLDIRAKDTLRVCLIRLLRELKPARGLLPRFSL
jgi:hypothetical protein